MCRECGHLKGCRVDDKIAPCRACSDEKFRECRNFIKSLSFNDERINKKHLCVICQEAHDVLIRPKSCDKRSRK